MDFPSPFIPFSLQFYGKPKICSQIKTAGSSRSEVPQTPLIIVKNSLNKHIPRQIKINLPDIQTYKGINSIIHEKNTQKYTRSVPSK